MPSKLTTFSNRTYWMWGIVIALVLVLIGILVWMNRSTTSPSTSPTDPKDPPMSIHPSPPKDHIDQPISIQGLSMDEEDEEDIHKPIYGIPMLDWRSMLGTPTSEVTDTLASFPQLDVYVLPEGTMFTGEFVPRRVRVFENADNIVVDIVLG